MPSPERLGRRVIDCDDRLGESLAAAVVLYTGALGFRFDGGMLVLPLRSAVRVREACEQ
jgi:hypothetical protein